MAIRPEARDANFTWRDFEAHVNSELNDVLGNFVHRTLTFINRSFESKVPEPHGFDEKDEALKKEIEATPTKVNSLLDQFQLKVALAAIIGLARTGNQYLSEREPWHLIKKDQTKTATTLYLAIQLVHTIGILISPFLPETAEQITKQLNLDEESGKWWNAGKLNLKPGHMIGEAKPLFHKVSVPAVK